MTTVEYETHCDLCGQPVEIEGFTLTSQEKVYRFCCAGCQEIYKLLYTNKNKLKSVSENDSAHHNHNNNEEN